MSFEISWDLSELTSACSDADVMLERGAAEAISVGLDAGAAFAKANHPYTDRTGGLTGSIAHEGDALVATQEYASFVEEGTSRSRAYTYAQPAADVAVQVATTAIETKVVADIQTRFNR